MKKYFLVWIVLGLVMGIAYKPTLVRNKEIFSVRQAGMGGAYTAIANDETVLDANPAGIGVRKMFQADKEDPIYYFLPIGFGSRSSVNEISRLISLVSDYSKLQEWYYNSIRNGGERISAYLTTPLDFVYAEDFWALSIRPLSFTADSSVGEQDDSAFQFNVMSQVKLGFNVYNFSILSDEDLHIGIAGKIFYSLDVDIKGKISFLDNFFDYYRTHPRELSVDKIILVVSDYLDTFDGIGIGLDFGLLWEIPIMETEHKINLGLVLEDAPTYGISLNYLLSLQDYFRDICTSSIEQIPLIADTSKSLCIFDVLPESAFFYPNPKIGVAYQLPNYMGNFLQDTLFALDFQRIGVPGYDFVDMYHLGASTTVFNFSDEETGRGYRMNVSMGVKKNQFNAGVLFHLKIYEMGYNYYRDKFAGRDVSFDRHVLSFAFYF